MIECPHRIRYQSNLALSYLIIGYPANNDQRGMSYGFYKIFTDNEDDAMINLKNVIIYTIIDPEVPLSPDPQH